MDRAGAAGFGISLVGHAALFAALSLALVTATNNPPPMPPAMEVSFVDEVAATASSPAPSPEPAAQSRAPEIGPVEDAAPAPAPPAPAPLPRDAVPAPSPLPTPRPPSRALPRPPAPAATAGTGQTTRRAGLGDLDPRSFGRDPASQSNNPPAAAMSAQAAADIGSAIRRQIQPCVDRQVIPYGAEQIVTQINLRLNRDGSLAARPRVVRQLNADGDNARYAQRAADIAIAAFTQCSPLRGLPQELYDVPRGWANFTLNYRLS
ncbi:MAG: cell envelope biogenesis protein TolA [Sphingomonadaceae bacterium]|nr:cell envelope biogenesis protein TolA [Sphingomonadaceae bacterium]